MQRLDLGKSHFFRPLVHSSCLGFCHQGVFLCVVSKNDCQLPLTHIDFASAWWHYWHKLAFFLFTHRNVLSRTLVESARVMWHAVVRPEEQTHQSSKEHKAGFSTGSLEFFGDVKAELSATTHQLPAKARTPSHPALYHAVCGTGTRLLWCLPKGVMLEMIREMAPQSSTILQK